MVSDNKILEFLQVSVAQEGKLTDAQKQEYTNLLAGVERSDFTRVVASLTRHQRDDIFDIFESDKLDDCNSFTELIVGKGWVPYLTNLLHELDPDNLPSLSYYQLSEQLRA